MSRKHERGCLCTECAARGALEVRDHEIGATETKELGRYPKLLEHDKNPLGRFKKHPLFEE